MVDTMEELVIEKEGRLSTAEIDKWYIEGYNVEYVEKDGKTYIWKSARAEAG